jgi:tRNA (guanine9-N1)-methyltransferase
VRSAYSINRASTLPLDLHLTGLTQGAGQLDTLGNTHWKNWRLAKHAPPAREVWPAASIVWLSPDAPDPLLSLDAAEVYVIGGIVDRNVKRGATLTRAREEGSQARRLPLDEYAAEHRSHTILSLTATVQILAAVHAGMDWGEAIRRSQESGTWFTLFNARQHARQQARRARR